MPFEAPAFGEVASALGAYFDGLHESDPARLAEVWHPLGRLYGVSVDGSSLVERGAEAFFEGVAARVRSEELAVHDRIVSIDTLGSSAAAAKVQVALPASGGGSTLFTDFLVLLRMEEGWQVISKVYSSVPLSDAAGVPSTYREPPQPDPTSANETNPLSGVVPYVSGGHSSDPAVMAQTFDEAARLCFVDQGTGDLVCWSREEFFEVVASRPPTTQDAFARQFDKVISVDKAGPDCALIKLQIGYPPRLYTDYLSMLRVGGVWRIIAKSSDHVPLVE